VAVANAGNPEFFSYPGLVLYLQAGVFLLVFGALSAIGVVSGGVWEVLGRGSLLRSPVELSVHAPGHLLTVLFSWAALEATYRITRNLTGSRGLGLLAGSILATAPLWVANAHYLTVDLPAAALVTLTLLAALHADGTGWDRRATIAVGVLFGLAVSAKYPSVLVLPSLVLVAASSGRSARSLARRGAAISTVGAAVFIVTNPYAVLDFPTFLEGVLREVRHARVGHFGYTAPNGWLFHISRSLVDGFGWAPLTLAALGFVGLARERDVSARVRAALLLFPLLHFAIVGRSELAFARYMLPVFPVLAALSGLGVRHTIRWVGRTGPEGAPAGWPLKRAVAVAVAAVVIFPNLRTATRHNALLARTDTRDVLTEVLHALGPPAGARRAFVGSFVWGALPREAGWSDQESISYLYHAPVKPPEMQPPAWPESIAFEELRSLPALVISPYDRERERVPFSPESAYSPFFPDLPFRTHPGPFIEVYLHDDGAPLADALAACARHRLRCRRMEAGEGYFAGTAGTAGAADPAPALPPPSPGRRP